MSAAIASITRANDKFHSSIGGRSDRGLHWKKVRFHVHLYLLEKLIKINRFSNNSIFQERNILIFIAHFDCHLGIFVKIYLVCFDNISFSFFINCNSCNFWYTRNLLLTNTHATKRCDFEEIIHKKETCWVKKSKRSRKQISQIEILAYLTAWLRRNWEIAKQCKIHDWQL